MNIDDLRAARKQAEDQIQRAVQEATDEFTKKTGLPIEMVWIHTSSKPDRELDGHKGFTVEGVTCDVNW